MTERVYYRRRRKLHTVGGVDEETGATLPGAPLVLLTTRYRFGLSRKKPHYIYYAGGVFYRARNHATAMDEAGAPAAWQWLAEPVAEATGYDVYKSQTAREGLPVVKLEIKDGRARAVGAPGTPYEGAALLTGDESPDYIESLLGFAPKRRRKMKD